VEADYYTKITKEIWQQWVFPETGDKNLEAIISIRIMRDGAVLISRVEKSSGNSLFDKSAVRAISKASPVTPPPREMEIGVRFYP
jgi:colicin import membrane protein